METIKASNVWDDDYIAPAETDKLRGECAKLYMETRDLDVRLDDIKYRQVCCRRIYSICIIVAVVLFLFALLIGAVELFYQRQPIDGLVAYIVNGGFALGALLAGISTLIFFSAMSVHPFWANCANVCRIEKLEIKRLGYVREQNAIHERILEIEKTLKEQLECQ